MFMNVLFKCCYFLMSHNKIFKNISQRNCLLEMMLREKFVYLILNLNDVITF